MYNKMDFLFSSGANSREIIANNLWFTIPFLVAWYVMMYCLGYFDRDWWQSLRPFDWFMIAYGFFILFIGWFYPIERECWKMIILYTVLPLNIYYFYDFFSGWM